MSVVFPPRHCIQVELRGEWGLTFCLRYNPSRSVLLEAQQKGAQQTCGQGGMFLSTGIEPTPTKTTLI